MTFVSDTGNGGWRSSQRSPRYRRTTTTTTYSSNTHWKPLTGGKWVCWTRRKLFMAARIWPEEKNFFNFLFTKTEILSHRIAGGCCNIPTGTEKHTTGASFPKRQTKSRCSRWWTELLRRRTQVENVRSLRVFRLFASEMVKILICERKNTDARTTPICSSFGLVRTLFHYLLQVWCLNSFEFFGRHTEASHVGEAHALRHGARLWEVSVSNESCCRHGAAGHHTDAKSHRAQQNQSRSVYGKANVQMCNGFWVTQMGACSGRSQKATRTSCLKTPAGIESEFLIWELWVRFLHKFKFNFRS